MLRTIFIAAALAAAALCTGCASIVTGQNQSVSVKTTRDGGDVSGAQCELKNDKGTWFTTTPGSVTVRRSYNDLLVTCKVADVEPGILSVKSSTKGMAFGNAIFGGVIGASIDVASGAAYDYPPLIQVTMPAGAAAKGTPQGPLDATNTSSTVAKAASPLSPSLKPTAPATPAAAPPMALGSGTLLVYQDFEAISGARQGETIYTVSERSADQWVLNQGSIIVGTNGTPIKGLMSSAMVYGMGPQEIARGGTWEGKFRAPDVANDVAVTLTLLDKQTRTISGVRFNAAHLKVEGYANQSGVSRGGGAPIDGELWVDTDTGLLIAISIVSRHSSYSVRRELVRVGPV